MRLSEKRAPCKKTLINYHHMPFKDALVPMFDRNLSYQVDYLYQFLVGWIYHQIIWYHTILKKYVGWLDRIYDFP